MRVSGREVRQLLDRRQLRRIDRVVTDVARARELRTGPDARTTWDVPAYKACIASETLTLPANPNWTATRWAAMPGTESWDSDGPDNVLAEMAQYVVGVHLDPTDAGNQLLTRWQLRLQWATAFDESIPPVAGSVLPVRYTSAIILQQDVQKLLLGGAPADDAWDAYALVRLPMQPAGAARVLIRGQDAAMVLANRTVFWGMYAGPGSLTIPLVNPYRAALQPLGTREGSKTPGDQG